MREYRVIINRAARVDFLEIRTFLWGVLSFQSAEKYANAMRAEIKSISIFADCFQRSTSKQILSIHPQARRMVSHNKRWVYIFHIEDDFAIVDRILSAKNIKQ